MSASTYNDKEVVDKVLGNSGPKKSFTPSQQPFNIKGNKTSKRGWWTKK